MKYNKLVRDRIPEIIKKNGQISVTHIANDKEYWQKLKEKLREETEEFMQDSGPCEGELADILEVVYAIRDYKKIDKKKLEQHRKKKAKERGGFKRRIILDETK